MLRSLIFSALSFLPTLAQAQSFEMSEQLRARIDDLVANAPEVGADLAERISTLTVDPSLLDGLDLDAVDPFADERVKSLLNIEDGQSSGLQQDGDIRYENRVVIFASFSIPDSSLRAILLDADRLGATVVFRGFVGNSVIDTRKRLEALFEDHGTAPGFAIDPTLFERFNVDFVPVVISIHEEIDVCLSSGCADDPVPEHDRVTGNIPLFTALEILARGGGPGSLHAELLLEASK